MSYPTPMDVAEAEDREAMADPFADELAKCSVLYTQNLVAEREALIAELAECKEKRERYALQVCLLLDAMREAGVHIAEKWCWCGPTVENHASDCAVHNEPALPVGPCSCGAAPSFDGMWHKLDCPER